MIAGVGIDMVSSARIADKVSKPDFKLAVFTEKEIHYCDTASNAAQHYAARFAIKEAFLKATGKGMAYDIDTLKQIEVFHQPGGQPAIKLTGALEKLKQAERWTSIHVSVSHEHDQAIAIVILEK